MSFFQRVRSTRLYIGPPEPDPSHRWLGYLLPNDASEEKIDLENALRKADGSFLFATVAPDLGTDAAIERFIAAVDCLRKNLKNRAIFWLPEPDAIEGAPNVAMPITPNGRVVIASGAEVPIVRDLKLVIHAGASLDLKGDVLEMCGNGAISFDGPAAPDAQPISLAKLPFTGDERGCVVFGAHIRRRSLHDDWSWGFQCVVPATGTAYRTSTLWLPLAEGSSPSSDDRIGFMAAIDPADTLNAVLPARTALVFTGENYDGSRTVLDSWFRTDTGAAIRLIPVPGPLADRPDAARLVFNPGAGDSPGRPLPFQAAPAGAFTLEVPPAAGRDADGAGHRLLCGLHGTEYAAFGPDDRLVFTPRRPAFVPGYPFPETSPVGPPTDPSAPLMDATYRTSWASLVTGGGGAGGPGAGDSARDSARYVAQPRGAALYGRQDPPHRVDDTLFVHVDSGMALPGDTVFPLLPYAGVKVNPERGTWSRDRIETVERTAVAPTRRLEIGEPPSGHVQPDGAADGRKNVTTPAGLLVTLGPGDVWERVLLGQNSDPEMRRMCFCAPGGELRQAFQSSELFLVAANATRLGRLTGAGGGECGAEATFQNAMNIADWRFAADVGLNRYDDYANVLIVKGREGPLYLPEDPGGSLVCNPERWTQRDVFAAPTDIVPGAAGDSGSPPAPPVGPPDPAELVVLSGWLRRYFADAAARTEPYFEHFNRLARDPAWTGVLVLRMRIDELPADLAGVVAGVTDPSRFHAHHFGIEISQVANDPKAGTIELVGDSSMFGLIDYVDPAFTPPGPGEATARPVPPPEGVEHDFRLLSLRAVFENTAVQEFESWAQLTVNRLFGMRVAGMGEGGNPFNTMVLRGHYQNDGSRPVQSLSGTGPSTFRFGDKAAVRKVEITGVRMSTRDPGDAEKGRDVVSWFDLSGFLDLKVMTDGERPFDVLSFGGEGDEDLPRRGLAFAGLGVRMAFPPAAPARRTMTSEFGEVRFDLGTSTPRRDSLFRDFALDLRGLDHGGADTPPQTGGYLPVVTGAPLTGVADRPWFGLAYDLKLGTPGDLAGEVGLVARLVTAWSTADGDGGDQEVMVGLGLPGTKGGATLFSLENVLKVSVGQIRLDRAQVAGAPDERRFMLTMDDIALRFLGLLSIPPSGSTRFTLFGDRDAAGPAGLGWYALYAKRPAAAAENRPQLANTEK